jgi:hypothetical protein
VSGVSELTDHRLNITLKMFIVRPSHTLSRDLLVIRQEAVQAGSRIVNWQLYVEVAPIVGLLEKAKCRKCGQEEEFLYHIFCHCAILAARRLEVFGCSSVAMAL